jgi:type I restriction enzyme M protein
MGKPMAEPILLRCPIRGQLNAGALAKDGLTVTEEVRRIEFIKFLIRRHYPPSYIDVETIVIKNLGESGRNKLRCDVIVYNVPLDAIQQLPFEDKLKKAMIVAEIKRDSSKKQSGIACQLEPAMRQLPGMRVMGVYYDDITRILYIKRLLQKEGGGFIEIIPDSLENLPRYGTKYESQPITTDKLSPPTNLVSILFSVANIMRSHGVNEERLRYKETVKLILARYCDEREALSSKDKCLNLQVLPGGDPQFAERVKDFYIKASKRYSRAKNIFTPKPESELEERTLREIIKLIQGTNFREASNDTMQQIFLSFVPAVFKKSLNQYFTPISLIETMVQMADIGSNDKIADPGMGTGDFLTAAMDYRFQNGDTDIIQRVFGIDIDQSAFDLAVINMVLNKDGQSNLYKEDSIANHSRWAEEIDVALCNPPFGENSIEKRAHVLMNYDLGHVWEYNDSEKKWNKTDLIAPSQQLGILFIERCYKLLSYGGRLAIILPEGYLCTKCYGYVRQWLIDHMRIVSLVELPRGIFKKSDADLRANILLAKKMAKDDLDFLKDADYPIHAELVRKVGYKLGKGFTELPKRDIETGVEIRDEDNRVILDSDFIGVRERFSIFSKKYKWRSPIRIQAVTFDDWQGARIGDVVKHIGLDLKPRRLAPRALANQKALLSSPHKFLKNIAEVVEPSIDLKIDSNPNKFWCLVEGMDIRATEGIVFPQFPCRAWEIIERKKGSKMFNLKNKDIIIGLVRPERRNVGILFSDEDFVLGAPDGIGVVRIKEEYSERFPQSWLFYALRSEQCRLQFWTESGGTSYGKLNREHILNIILPMPSDKEIKEVASNIESWFTNISDATNLWNNLGTEDDRRPIRNSPILGLEAPEDFD